MPFYLLFILFHFLIAWEPPAGKGAGPEKRRSLFGRANGVETGLSQKVSHILFPMCRGPQSFQTLRFGCPTLRGPNPEEYRSIPPLRRSYGWKLVIESLGAGYVFLSVAFLASWYLSLLRRPPGTATATTTAIVSEYFCAWYYQRPGHPRIHTATPSVNPREAVRSSSSFLSFYSFSLVASFLFEDRCFDYSASLLSTGSRPSLPD